MNKTLSVAALALALTGSAMAADLPSYKAPLPPPPPPPPLWTGFYVGLNAGGTWSNSNSIWTSAFPIDADLESPGIAASAASWLAGNNNGGFIGGGQIGYNWQFYNNFVAGVEADIQGVAYSSGAVNTIGVSTVFANDTGLTFTQARKNLDYIGTVRGRLGWLFTPTLLAYGTGGLAYGGVSLNTNLASFELEGVFGALNSAGFGAASYSDTRVGWTAGGGLEWMFWPNWSAKVEYLYYDLGTVSLAAPVVIGFNAVGGAVDWSYAANTRARFNGNIVRAGVNYHFNWGVPPVLAKY
ncbi:MAG: porin family protein [Methylocystis sp.]|nr:porin family protein [Methylocystis sp.]